MLLWKVTILQGKSVIKTPKNIANIIIILPLFNSLIIYRIREKTAIKERSSAGVGSTLLRSTIVENSSLDKAKKITHWKILVVREIEKSTILKILVVWKIENSTLLKILVVWEIEKSTLLKIVVVWEVEISIILRRLVVW